MDGINPTLAFAALLFGLHGNAHNATQDQQLESYSAIDCPAFTLSSGPTPPNLESWTETLASSLASAYELPGLHEPELNEPVPAKDQSDPITRRMVPVAATGEGPESDPCAPR